jgi:hypothetical protein
VPKVLETCDNCQKTVSCTDDAFQSGNKIICRSCHTKLATMSPNLAKTWSKRPVASISPLQTLPITHVHRPTRKRRKLLILFGIVLLLVIVDQALVWWNRRITLGPDTTRITAPLNDGYPDYLAYINHHTLDGVAPADNAAIPILALTCSDDLSKDWLGGIYGAWGIPQPSAKSSFVSYAEWAKSNADRVSPTRPILILNGVRVTPTTEEYEAEIVESLKAPWAATAHPVLAAWIAEMDPAIRQLDAASKLPRYACPYVTGDGRAGGLPGKSMEHILIPGLGLIRSLCEADQLRALMRLHDGDPSEVPLAVLRSMRMARLLARQDTIIEYLVAAALERSAARFAQRAAASPLLDAARADALRQQIVALPPFPRPTSVIDLNERFAALQYIIAIRQLGFQEAMEADAPTALLLHIIPVNFNDSLRHVNDFYDRLVKAFELPTFAQRHVALQALDDELAAMRSRNSRVRTDFSNPALLIYVGSVTRVDPLATEATVENDLAQIALALRTANSAGGFPNRLEDLSLPGFTPPPDRFTEKPFVYTRVGKGYTLASPGFRNDFASHRNFVAATE